MYGVKKFHTYLCGRHFTMYSDHQPLRRLFNESKGIPAMAASWIQRWALTLSAYEYSIAYRPGKEHAKADALSRLPLPQQTNVPVPGDLLLLQDQLDTISLVTTEQIRTWTEKDPVLSRVSRFILSGWPEHDVGDDFRHFRRRKDELSVLDGCVLRGSRVVIPPPAREAVMEELHETHPGIVKMKSLARSYVWWPNMNAELEARVKACKECQASRPPAAVAPLHPWEWPSKPW